MGGIAGGIGTAFSSVFSGPLGNLSYVGNVIYPFKLPEAQQIFDAYRAGYLSDKYTSRLLNAHGIQFEPGMTPENRYGYQQAWQAIYDSGFKYPDKFTYWRAYQAGQLTRDDWLKSMGREGTDVKDWVQLWEYQLEWPGVGQWDDAWLRGYLSPADWERGRKAMGLNLPMFDRLLESRRRQPSVEDASLMRLRGIITPRQWDQVVQRNGFDLSEWIGPFQQMMQELPPISDLVRFQVREAMDPALARALSLYDERPALIEPWFEKLGFGGGPGFQIHSDGQDREGKWSDIYWASHWQPISPTQAYTMFHRLRPDRMERYRAIFPDLKPFLLEDVRRALRVSDYPPNVRDSLTAIAYNPMRLVDIKNRLKFFPGEQMTAWAVGQLQDRGYHPDDAKVAVDLFIKQGEDALKGPIKNVEKQAPTKLWKVVEEAYYVGTMPMDRFLAFAERLGVSRAAAQTTLERLDAQWALNNHKAIMKAIRSDYMSGLISDAEMMTRMLALDMQQGARDSTVRMWRIQRGSRRKTIAAKDAAELYRIGLMGEAELRQRLVNLGFDLQDTTFMVARAQVEIGQDRVKAMKAAERERAKNANDMEKAIKEAQGNIRRFQADLSRMTPIAKIVKWAGERRVDEDWFRSRLDAMGYAPDAIDLHWADVEAVLEEEEADEQGEEEGSEEA